MYQQYLNQAQSAISNLDTDALKELMNDDEKLEIHVNEVVCYCYYYTHTSWRRHCGI